MAALVDLLHHPVAEAQVTLLTFDAAMFSIEWQVFLFNPIAAWLTHVTVQSKGYGSTSRAKSGSIVQVTVLLTREDSLTIRTLVISVGMRLIILILDLESRKSCDHIVECLYYG